MKAKTSKAETFADDQSAMGKSIEAMKENIENFGVISGLKCNMDKSMILVTGTDVIPDYISQSGFRVTDNVTILGFNITRRYNDLTENFTKVVSKIKNIANYWDRYKLSLMGRINIAKCLMLSQLSYIGTIVQPTDNQLNEIETTINGYVSSSLWVGKANLDTCTKKGGLGLINLREFIFGLQCSWAKKSQHSKIDNWRAELKELAKDTVATLSPTDIVQDRNPILYNISVLFYNFKKEFYRQNLNIIESNIFGNPHLIKSSTDKSPVYMRYLLEPENDNYNLCIRDLGPHRRSLNSGFDR
jgi:hypothetical protein